MSSHCPEKRVSLYHVTVSPGYVTKPKIVEPSSWDIQNINARAPKGPKVRQRIITRQVPVRSVCT